MKNGFSSDPLCDINSIFQLSTMIGGFLKRHLFGLHKIVSSLLAIHYVLYFRHSRHMFYSKKENLKSLRIIITYLLVTVWNYSILSNLVTRNRKKNVWENLLFSLTSRVDSFCTVSRVDNIIILCNLSKKQNTMTLS